VAFTCNDHGHPIMGSTHNGTYAVPFKVHGGVDSIMVYAHDSGQRYHWSFAAEPAIRSCQEWFEDPYVPDGCVGTVNLVPLSSIGDEDEYVG
jgi:hypothetical protein